jgi:SAM-dependent methyltransferase
MTTWHQLDADGIVFNRAYAAARGDDPRALPWAHGAPHPMFKPWLDAAASPSSDRDLALVVGSGLGDDAEALAALGWNVTAFDISEQAIAWTRERFPNSSVDYHVRSLFALPEDWRARFNLVVEIHTVQSLPVTRRQAAIGAIAGSVAPGGSLIVVAITRDVRVPLRGRPWPLSNAELRTFARHALVETARVVPEEPTSDRPGRVRCQFTRLT